MRLREVKDFDGNLRLNIQGYHGSNLYFTLQSDDILYFYDEKENTAVKVLRWEDSDLYSSSVMQLWLIGEEQILVQYDTNSEKFFYLLNRTPVEELPKKELIVLASLSPDPDLQKAVVEFNRQSEKYRCVIERYGAGFGVQDEGAELRLDAALLSSAPPDILDTKSVDIYKYAEKGVLEDLSLYVSNTDREDFLDGLLEGYTIGGKLVCIPTCFTLSTIVGRDSQTGSLESWGIEDVYMLMERYPECTELISSGIRKLDGKGEAEGKGRDYMLEEFFSTYYLERFVGGMALDKELVLREYQLGDKIKILGFPTSDGRGRSSGRVMNKLGMVSHSLNKEGAWNFLEYYISIGTEDSFYLPTRKSLLKDRAEKAVAPPDGKIWISFGKDSYEYNGIPQYLVDALMEQIESIDFSPMLSAEEQIISIVTEEAESYYNGDKGLEEVTAVIQNRVQLSAAF